MFCVLQNCWFTFGIFHVFDFIYLPVCLLGFIEWPLVVFSRRQFLSACKRNSNLGVVVVLAFWASVGWGASFYWKTCVPGHGKRIHPFFVEHFVQPTLGVMSCWAITGSDKLRDLVNFKSTVTLVFLLCHVFVYGCAAVYLLTATLILLEWHKHSFQS